MPLTDKPGRAWAEDLVMAWIDGRDTTVILSRIPATRKSVAIKIARSNCESIKLDARRVAAGLPISEVHRGRRELVRKYLDQRLK